MVLSGFLGRARLHSRRFHKLDSYVLICTAAGSPFSVRHSRPSAAPAITVTTHRLPSVRIDLLLLAWRQAGILAPHPSARAPTPRPAFSILPAASASARSRTVVALPCGCAQRAILRTFQVRLDSSCPARR